MIKRLTLILLLAGIGSLFAGLVITYVPDEELNLTASYYAEKTAEDLGAANIVTAIIVTYRGLDTLGEVTVLFLTAAIVGLVLSQSRGRSQLTIQALDNMTSDDGSTPTPTMRRELPPTGELLSTGTRLLLPLILLFGAYVFSHGHLTPGGGFQGGAILASAMLLLLLSNPAKRFGHRLITLVESTAGLSFILIGILGILLAGGFLDNRILPTGTFGELFSAGAIPLIYTLVGLKVGAEFSSMLVSLSETEEL
ncbi:MAG: MnhB domain-containing protein [Chromatiales bacterium]|jgi:multicomponent Na+:H+ antiporter subunit B